MSDKFKCNQCNKLFTTKIKLNYHIDNGVCTKNKNIIYICDLCNKNFTSNYGVQYHKKHNVCADKTMTESNNVNTSISGTDITDINYSNHATVKSYNTEITNNYNNTYNITIKNVIVPPKFLKPNTYTRMRRRFPNLYKDAIYKSPANCIMYVLQNTTSNKNSPYYNSVLIKSLTGSYYQVSDGEKYIHVPAKSVIKNLIENITENLEDYINKHKSKFPKRKIQTCSDYLNSIELKGEVYKNLRLEIIAELYNIKDNIQSDEWIKVLQKQIILEMEFDKEFQRKMDAGECEESDYEDIDGE
jgi:hypothetical protein